MSRDMLLALCHIYKCNNIQETFGKIEADYKITNNLEKKSISNEKTNRENR